MASAAEARQPRDDAPASASGTEPHRSSTGLFLAALVARTWLWFVAGCLLVTLLPMVIGWRPFVVESGSMQPRIDVGDIVLAAPETDPQTLLGRVTVFNDPEKPESTKTHRVVAINDDGTMTTKGDANPNADTAPLRIEDVRGLGRLLVTFAGLPMVWMHTGQYFYLGLFLLSLVIASYLVGRDRDEELPEDVDGSSSGGPDGPDGEIVPLPTRLSDGGTALGQAASKPLDPGLRRDGAFAPLRRRSAWILVLVAALFAPTGTAAAFSATTRNSANSFTVPNWSYTTTVTGYSPYLYWKLDETGNTTTAADASGNGRTGTYTPNANAANFTRGVAGAFVTDTPDTGVTLNSANACINTTSNTAIAGPQSVTVIAWFNGTGTTNGKLVGFETPRTGVGVAGNGGTYDRHLYVDGNGQVWWGVYNNGFFTVGSGATDYTDGQWHMAVGVLGPSGMALYVDGVLRGTNANNAGEATTGWWRAGCGNLAGWGASWGGTNSPTTNSGTTQNRPFTGGSLDEVSVHNSVLTAAQIYQAYIAR